MSLKIHNTLTGKKELFKPIEEGIVKMYVCGVTAYDSSHVGHARAAVAFDIIYRYLMYKGYQVQYVRNFTDVDDKIINRALKEKVSCHTLAERYINEYRDDMKKLNLLTPTFEPKATEHIREMQDIITRLLEKGHAYVKEGDVFFDVESFRDYGKLSGRTLNEMRAGARIEVDKKKKNPFDFVLWKSSKPGEPEWESPWGNGRPGWHIECSAMSMKYLGQTPDIHGGGQDLIFPHHENEIAQSEACTGKPFAKYWIHNGFVTIDKEKMSKSLGNIFVIRNLYKKWHPKVLRYFLISKHYRSPIDFNQNALNEAKKTVERIENSLALFEQQYAEILSKNKIEETEFLEYLTGFEHHMDDDFNTSGALSELFLLINALNESITNRKKTEENIKRYFAIKKMLELLGIKVESSRLLNRMEADEDIIDADSANKTVQQIIKKLENNTDTKKDINKLIMIRNRARKKKNWAMADNIRTILLEHNIHLRDEKDTTIWIIKK